MHNDGINTVIVGSSRELLKKNLGSVIDTFDHVIRCNAYRIEGYEKHVGSKQKIWAVNLGLASHIPTVRKKVEQGNVRYVWYIGNSYDIEKQFLDTKKLLKKQFVVESINFDVAELIEELKNDFVEEKLCFERNKIRLGPHKKYATTGLRAIFKAIEKFGRAYICGFTSWRECVGSVVNSHYYEINNVPTHMHKAFTESPSKEHDPETEEKIIQKLVDMKYLIRMEDVL